MTTQNYSGYVIGTYSGGVLSGTSRSASASSAVTYAGNTIAVGQTVMLNGVSSVYEGNYLDQGTQEPLVLSNGVYYLLGESALMSYPIDSVAYTQCFAAGTLIATDAGDVAVETLGIGDHVVTASGRVRPVRWVGHRSFAGRFYRANAQLHPIRFRAGCLGGGLPRRDLLISPEHAMLLDGVLVPARFLLNGTSIVRDSGADGVDYFHIELDSHDVVLAEGAASETFMDEGAGRGMFQNAAEYAALYPDTQEPTGFCARRVESGFELEAIRARLAALPCMVPLAA